MSGLRNQGGSRYKLPGTAGHGGPAGETGLDYVAFVIASPSHSATDSQSLCLPALVRCGRGGGGGAKHFSPGPELALGGPMRT